MYIFVGYILMSKCVINVRIYLFIINLISKQVGNESETAGENYQISFILQL